MTRLLSLLAAEAAYRFVELPAGHWLPETRAEELAGLVLERVGGTANTP